MEEPAASDGNADSAPVATEDAAPQEAAGDQTDGAEPAEPEARSRAPDYEDDFEEGGEAPAASAEEDRAEAGAVVPVPVEESQKSDGRSAEQAGGERGEDRPELQAGEPSDDSRGQGQWKGEDEAFLASSLSNQQAEKEALQKVIDEKVAVQKEYDDLKGRYLLMEQDSQHWDMELTVLKEKCQQQEQRITELQAEEKRLRDFEHWGKDNEAKVKDLQGRLATLASEDAEKDRRIQKLQEDLAETTSRLVAAERQAVLSNEAAQRQQAPKSKTCVVM
jgi:hypothetical protein